MAQRTHQKRNHHRDAIAGILLRSEIHMSAQKVVDRDIPFATEFQPVRGVPPVLVEVAVGEAGNLCKGAEEVLPDDEEDEQEDDHEGKEEEGSGFGEDE